MSYSRSTPVSIPHRPRVRRGSGRTGDAHVGKLPSTVDTGVSVAEDQRGVGPPGPVHGGCRRGWCESRDRSSGGLSGGVGWDTGVPGKGWRLVMRVYVPRSEWLWGESAVRDTVVGTGVGAESARQSLGRSGVPCRRTRVDHSRGVETVDTGRHGSPDRAEALEGTSMRVVRSLRVSTLGRGFPPSCVPRVLGGTTSPCVPSWVDPRPWSDGHLPPSYGAPGPPLRPPLSLLVSLLEPKPSVSTSRSLGTPPPVSESPSRDLDVGPHPEKTVLTSCLLP